RLVDLEERFLEDVLGCRPVAEEADQEMKQLAFIAVDQLGKCAALALAVACQQHLVGALRFGEVHTGGGLGGSFSLAGTVRIQLLAIAVMALPLAVGRFNAHYLSPANPLWRRSSTGK